MESFIAMGVDGIAIAPSDPTALAPTIATAMSKDTGNHPGYRCSRK